MVIAVKHLKILTITNGLIGISLFSIFVHAQILWEPDVRLTEAPGFACCCDLSVHGDTIFVVWNDERSSIGTEVYFLRSTDAGLNWSGEKILSLVDTYTSHKPDIISRGDTVHVVYADYRYIGECVIYYRRSIDGGLTWEPEILLSPWWRAGSSPGITLGNDQDVYVIWDDFDSYPHLLMLRKSTDGGVTWQPATVDSSGYSLSFGFLYGMQTLHLVNTSSPTMSCEIGYRKSTDEGVTWSDYDILSPDDSISSQHPSMCGDSIGNLYVVWYDYKYSLYAWTGDIFFCKSTDNGRSWSPYKQLTNLHRAVLSDICVSGDSLYVVWEDDRNEFNQNFEIYFRTNSGETWLPEMRLTDAPKNSCSPEIAVSKDWIHVIWFDSRDSIEAYSELYYKRGRRFVGIEETSNSNRDLNYISIHPNPFTQTLYIKLLNWTENLKIKIFDPTGKEVIVRNVINNEIKIDTNDLPGGVYFVQLQASDFNETKKVILLK